MRGLVGAIALLLSSLAVVAGPGDGAGLSGARGNAGAASAAPAGSVPAAAGIATDANAKPGAAHADTKGFRSASFGSSEDAVRSAIQKDFGLSGDKVSAEENYSEQTRLLSIRVPDLLPGGGAADVAYIFGFKSKTLIQVSVSWSKASDETITPERLFSNANVLRAHFAAAGYQPETVVTNAMVSNGLLMFRGNDVAGRTTLLVLQGSLTPGQNSQQVLAPTALLLFYIADAKNPDVFKLEPGQF